MSTFKDAFERVGTLAHEGVAEVTKGLAGLTKSEARRLTPAQQVQRFLRMSDDQLAQVQMNLGPEQWERYRQTMLGYMEEGY